MFTNLRTYWDFTSFPTNVLSLAQDPVQAPILKFSCHGVLFLCCCCWVSSNLWQFLSLSLFFLNLIHMKSTDELFYKKSLNLHRLMFCHDQLRLCTLPATAQKCGCVLLGVSCTWGFMGFFTGDTNFYHLFKVVSAWLPHCEVTTHNQSILWGDDWRLCKYSVSHQIVLDSCSVHPLVLACSAHYCDVLLMVIFCRHFLYIYLL